jgi:hypothetical protein
MRGESKITAAWLDLVLGPRHQVIAPTFYDPKNRRRTPQKLSTAYLRMALNDYETVRGLLLKDGQERLPRGRRTELVDALADRWNVDGETVLADPILAVLEGRRTDPR